MEVEQAMIHLWLEYVMTQKREYLQKEKKTGDGLYCSVRAESPVTAIDHMSVQYQST